MREGRMRQEHDAQRAHVLLELLHLCRIERYLPADVHEDLDPAIEFEEGLAGGGWRLGPKERSEGEHFVGVVRVIVDT